METLYLETGSFSQLRIKMHEYDQGLERSKCVHQPLWAMGNKVKMRNMRVGNLMVPSEDGKQHLSGYQHTCYGKPFNWMGQAINRNGMVQLVLGPGKACVVEDRGQDS